MESHPLLICVVVERNVKLLSVDNRKEKRKTLSSRYYLCELCGYTSGLAREGGAREAITERRLP